MKNKDIIFDRNIRTLGDFKDALRICYEKFNEIIDPKFYYSLILTKRTKKRTILQNNLLHIFLTHINNNHDQLDTVAQWKIVFRAMFLEREEKDVNYNTITAYSYKKFQNAQGCNFHVDLITEITKLAKSTTELTTVEFKEFLVQISQFASDNLGVIVVFPDEEGWDKFFNEYKNK